MNNSKKVAFDCQGTLFEGGKVVKLYKWFESKGCEMIIWSGLLDYAMEAKKMFNLNGSVGGKTYYSYDPEEQEYFVDIAVDDNGWFDKEDNIPLLGTHNLIDVTDIPEDESEFEAKFGHLLK